MKKIYLFMMLALMIFGMSSNVLALDNIIQEPIVRVQITNTNSSGVKFNVTKIKFELRGDYKIEGTNTILNDRTSSNALIYYQAQLLDGKVKIYDLTNSKYVYEHSAVIRLVPVDPNREGDSIVDIGRYINGTYYGINKYRGIIEFRKLFSSLVMINELNVEDYLKGVVPIEMSSSWELEALKAQAVVARSYALRHMSNISYPDYINDTVSYQAYRGYSRESSKTNSAVLDTLGQVLTKNGNIISAFFSASSGGYTEAAPWGTTVSYLKSVEDPFDMISQNPNTNWSKKYTKKELQDRLRSKGINVGEIENVEIFSTSDSGRVKQLKVTGSEGVQYLVKSPDSMRIAFGLKSSLFTIKYEGGKSFAQSDSNIQQVTNESYVLDQNGNITLLNDLNGANVVNSDGNTNFNIIPEAYIFVGSGWGHGAGMSQWGAQGMALSGENYLDIINQYYNDVNIIANYNK